MPHSHRPWLENVFLRCFFSRPPSYWYPLLPLFVQHSDAVALGAALDGDDGAAFALLGSLISAPPPLSPTHRERAVAPLDPSRRYVLVSAFAMGPLLHWRNCSLFSNVLVLSSGGWGDVPLPHLMPLPLPLAQRGGSRPHFEREHLFSFQGRTEYATLRHVPSLPGSTGGAEGLAPSLSFTVGGRNSDDAEGSSDVTVSALASGGATLRRAYEHYSRFRPAVLSAILEQRGLGGVPADDDLLLFAAALTSDAAAWQGAFAKAALVLAPRGFGPTSYRLYEALQAGSVPVYVWGDGVEWLPYRKRANELWGSEGVALSVRADAMGEFVRSVCLLFGTAIGKTGPLDGEEGASKNGAAEAEQSHFPVQPSSVCAVPIVTRGLSEGGNINEGGGPSQRARVIHVPPASILARMEARIPAARDEFFTLPAVMRHVAAFFEDPASSDLLCQGKHRVEFRDTHGGPLAS